MRRAKLHCMLEAFMPFVVYYNKLQRFVVCSGGRVYSSSVDDLM